jgi:hypothetical protein
VPGHEFALGVIVYVAVCAVVEVFVNVWAILEPVPAEAPVKEPLVATVQLNVVPVTLLVKAMPVVPPEQND